MKFFASGPNPRGQPQSPRSSCPRRLVGFIPFGGCCTHVHTHARTQAQTQAQTQAHTNVEVNGNTDKAVVFEDGRNIRDVERRHEHF